MLEGLRSVSGGNEALPFVLQFYGSPSSYLWDDDEGETHEIKQGKGGGAGGRIDAAFICPRPASGVAGGPIPAPFL